MKSLLKKHRIVATVLGFVLSAAAGALAAFFIYTGVTGSAGGKVTSTVSTVGAITLVADSTDATELSPGGTADAAFMATNNDPNHGGGVTITSATAGAITSNIPACDTSTLHFDASGLVGRHYALGDTNKLQILTGAWSADNGLSQSCVGATLSVALTGVTSAT